MSIPSDSFPGGEEQDQELPGIASVAEEATKEASKNEHEPEREPVTAPSSEAQQPNGGPLGCCLGIVVGVLLTALLTFLTFTLSTSHSLILSNGGFLGLATLPVVLAGGAICGYVGWRIGKKFYREYEAPVLTATGRRVKSRSEPKSS